MKIYIVYHWEGYQDSPAFAMFFCDTPELANVKLEEHKKLTYQDYDEDDSEDVLFRDRQKWWVKEQELLTKEIK